MSDTVAPTDIAIIGMAGRFPACRDLDEFWKNLRDGVECIRRPTDVELLAAGVDPAELRDPRYVMATGDLADVGGFDAGFFGYSPKDAAILDPQHRHFYECAWAALEQAGHTAAGFPGPIGVFAGCGPNLYFMRNVLPNPELMRSVGYFLLRHTGNDRDFLPTGVSYKLNLRGPSIAVQTACSTSLVAIHLASQSLLNGECDLALAGGVTIDVPHGHGYIYRVNEVLSPDGHCRPFDASSGGTVLSSGCGVVVLRRAEDAIADGDFVHAVIKGSAVNNDGSNKVGYLAPSVEGHAEVVAEALAMAGLTADDISYLEAHGTGTAVGDPIEIAALTKAFRRSSDRKQFCPIGSVKANIGHTDTAAGIAALFKIVESLKHRQIPKSLNYLAPNPSIDFESSPFFVNTELREWSSNGKPRRAGVSSLGVGGTNVHAIIEEAPAPSATDSAEHWQPLLLSAKTPTALDQMTSNLTEHLRAHPNINLADVAFTLHSGRSAFEHRRVIVARDLPDAVNACQDRDAKRLATGKALSGEPSIVFMFPGGGVQYPNMGRDLYDTEELYREIVDECLRLLKPHIDFDLRSLMFPEAGHEMSAAEQLRDVRASICAIFIAEFATAQLLLSWGIKPTAMTGHSLGEYTAACVAGVMALADALRIVALRGRLLKSTADASMMSVPLPEADVAELLGDNLDLAAINGPALCLISGLNEQLKVVEEALAEREIECRRLHLSAASHCRLVEPILEEFRAGLQSIQMSPPELPYVSNVTGTWVRPQDATDPNYWVRHLRNCVRFGEGISELLKLPNPVLLEVGPGRTLASLARQQEAKPAAVITSIRHPDEQANDVQFLRTALGRLWTLGVRVDWSHLDGSARRQRLPLPSYPFEHQHYWLEPVKQSSDGIIPPANIEKLPSLEEWFSKPVWKPVVVSPPAKEAEDASAPVTLIFLDSAGLGTRVAAQLRAGGEIVVTVREGDAFYKFSDHDYALAAEEGRAGYDELIVDLVENGLLPSRILHMWLVTKDRSHRPGSSFFHRNQERGVYSLTFLAQAFGEQEQLRDLHVTVVSNGMQSVSGEPVEHPDKATVLGPVRVIPREYEHITCSSVDIELPLALHRRKSKGSDNCESIVSQLLAELRTRATHTTIAMRQQRRFELNYEPVKVEVDGCRERLQMGGTYVITGGLGGIGLRLASYLARAYQARLVLVSRSGLPQRDKWDQWFEHHSKREAVSQRILAVQDMESHGAQVLIAAADVANIDDMQRVIIETRKRFGKIDGVFHTAAVLDDSVLQTKTPESMDRVLTPKVHGTMVLAELLADCKLDFFVLFSSTSAVFGPTGQADYTAANCFLNAFAETEVARQMGAVAINWGVWKDVGMGLHVAEKIIGGATDEGHLHRRTSHPLLDECIYDEPEQSVFATTLSVSRNWLLNEHRVQSGRAVVPGTGYLELASAAFVEATKAERFEIRDLSFIAPLAISDDELRELRILLLRSGQESKWEIKSRVEGNWLLHASGSIRLLDGLPVPAPIDVQAVLERCPKVMETDGAGLISNRQMELLRFGPRWRVVQSAKCGIHEALADLCLPAEYASDIDAYRLHPAILDLATGFALPLVKGYEGANVLYVPMSYGRVRVYGRLPSRVFSHVRSYVENDIDREIAMFDVTIADEHGNVVIEVEKFTVRRIANTSAFAAPTSHLRSGELLRDNIPPGERLFLELIEAGIDGDEGVTALLKILNANESLPHIVASSISLDVLLERFKHLKESPDESKGVKFARPNLTSAYEAPRNTLERQLAEFWEELLGIDNVGIHDDFFELGGHSLIAVRLFAKIKKIWNAEYPISVLFEAPTIAGCAEILRQEIGDVREDEEQAATIRARRHRYLVPMNRVVDATRPPFFLVAGMFGNVLNLRHLAGQLGADQPVFALQARGLHGDDEPHTRFEDMARDYLDEIRQIQSRGPYFLGGFSGGGISAYEMAQQLTAQGERIGALVMLDTPPPPPCTPQLNWQDRMLIQAYRIRRRGFRYCADWARNRWAWEMRRFRPAEAPELTPAEFRSGEIHTAFLEALQHYKPSIYAGDIHLFRPRLQETYALGGGRFASDARIIVDHQNHWTPFVTGTIHVHEVTGDHDSMVLEPHVRALVRDLRTCLIASQAQLQAKPSSNVAEENHDAALVSAH